MNTAQVPRPQLATFHEKPFVFHGMARHFTLPTIVTVLFGLLCGLTIAHHAMWRDEALAFLYARDSHSLAEMAYPMQYDGHPPLWHLMLFVLTRFTLRPEAAQVLHLVLATLTVYLFTRFAPFPRVCRILFPFGYYVFFEYGVIARNYQLFMLLSVLFCVLYTQRRHAYIGLASILSLLCFTHVLGIILATGFGAVLLYDIYWLPSGRAYRQRHGVEFSAALLLIAVSVTLSVITLIPPDDLGLAVGWQFDLATTHVFHTLGAFWYALVPIPILDIHFWNTGPFPGAIEDFGGECLALLFLFLLRRSRRACLLLLIVDVGAATFLHAKIFTGWRQTGELFVAVLCGMWIACGQASLWSVPFRRARRRLTFWLTGLLAIQVVGAIVATGYSWRYPFTVGDQVARFLDQPQYKEYPLIISADLYASSIAAYLPGRSIFFPRGSRWGTYSIGRADASERNPLQWAITFANLRNAPTILIYHGTMLNPPEGVTSIGSFSGGIVADESFTLFRVLPRRQGTSLPDWLHRP